MGQIKLNDIIAPTFHKLFKPFFQNLIDELVLKGGRGTTKSSVSPLFIVMGMMNDFHNKGIISNAICLRKVALSLKKSVYNNILWAIDMLDCADDWYCTKSPLECTYKPSGQKILFSGCDDPKKLKGLKFEKGFNKYVWIEEVDEFKDMAEIRNILQTTARGEESIIIYTFNPPPSSNNWVNFEFSKVLDNRLVHESTYLDVPKHWLGATFFRMAEQLKQDNYKAYENEYLGISGGLGGEIFTNVINYPTDVNLYDKFRNGLDFGYTDPTAFIRLYHGNGEIVLLDEIYEQFITLENLKDKINNKIDLNDLILADSASPTSISELRQKGLYIVGAKKPKNSVKAGIKWLQSLKSIKIDRKKCPKAYWEFSTYERERDKFGEFKPEFPDKNNHIIDATRYALSDIINVSGWKVPKN